MLAEADRCPRTSCFYIKQWRQCFFVATEVFGNAQG